MISRRSGMSAQQLWTPLTPARTCRGGSIGKVTATFSPGLYKIVTGAFTQLQLNLGLGVGERWQSIYKRKREAEEITRLRLVPIPPHKTKEVTFGQFGEGEKDSR
jgi:hypothetical protein